jgi:hypothetical protein
MVYVNNGDESGVYAALEWSSGRVIAKGKKDYHLTLSVDMDGVSYEKEDFSTKVPASDTFVFPSVYYGVYDGTVDDGSNVFKSWFFNCKSPEILAVTDGEYVYIHGKNEVKIPLSAFAGAVITYHLPFIYSKEIIATLLTYFLSENYGDLSLDVSGYGSYRLCFVSNVQETADQLTNILCKAEFPADR